MTITATVVGIAIFQKNTGPLSTSSGQCSILKFIPKYPVMKVNGRKIREAMVSCLIDSF
jgi:hypothetical protein